MEGGERFVQAIQIKQAGAQAETCDIAAGIERQRPLKRLARCIPTVRPLQAQRQIVVRIRVVRFRLDHREVTQGRVVKMPQGKLDFAANRVEVRVEFARTGQRAQRLLQPAGRAQRQRRINLGLNAGLERDLDNIRRLH